MITVLTVISSEVHAQRALVAGCTRREKNPTPNAYLDDFECFLFYDLYIAILHLWYHPFSSWKSTSECNPDLYCSRFSKHELLVQFLYSLPDIQTVSADISSTVATGVHVIQTTKEAGSERRSSPLDGSQTSSVAVIN